MDFWEAIPQIWGFVSQGYDCFRGLKHNVTTLMKETGKLKRKHEEVEDEVCAAESVGKKRRCEVGDWLQDVDEILPEVESIQLEFEQGSINPFSRYHLSKRVVEKIEVVKALQDKGIFDEVAKSPSRPLMTELQVPRLLEQQSTAQETLKEIEEALSDEEVGVVGVCGVGGIGKTTFMKKVYNRLAGTRDFHVVIWVTVSQDLNLNAIQQKIGNMLGVQFPDNESEEEKRDRLYARLRNVRYMLILDDLWEAFSLDQVGIPLPDKENGCKIAITTRLIAVTSEMEAHNEIRATTIHMKTLSSEEAWDLFCSKTGDAVLLPRIKPVAEEVVKECGGLPLAIQTVGVAMRRKYRESLWENALRSLKGSAPEVRGMERREEDELVHDISRPLSILPGGGEDASVHTIQSSVLIGRGEEELIHDILSRPLSILPGRAEDELVRDISRPLSILPGGGEDVSVHTIQSPVLIGRGEELIHDILSRPLSILPGT